MTLRFAFAGQDGSDDSDADCPQEESLLHRNLLQGETPTVTNRTYIPTVKLGSVEHRCHVCGQVGHEAGFLGATYVDCPNKPCYLCGESGHSTMTCPHRKSPGHGCSAALDARSHSKHLVSVLAARQIGDSQSSTAKIARSDWPPFRPLKRWRLEGAVVKLHSRRVTALTFHPTLNSIVLSADKRGEIGVWNTDTVHERTVYNTIHKWQASNIVFLPGMTDGGLSCASSSHDGTVQLFDPGCGASHEIFNVNVGFPDWNGNGEMDTSSLVQREKEWVTMLGLDAVDSHVLAVGDSVGMLRMLDVRAPDNQPVATLQAQKKGTKIQSVHVNPADRNLILTAGNDYVARIFDARMVQSPNDSRGVGEMHEQYLAAFEHPKVINSAWFSPHSGRKIITTCQDNRLRVFDHWAINESGTADRAIVHSHTFNRYLTPFKAEWCVQDPTERMVVIGRYISEDFGGVALHPIDLLDVSTGDLLAELVNPNVTTICPVNKMHPRKDLIISGSSRSLYAWSPILEQGECAVLEPDADGVLPWEFHDNPDVFDSSNPDELKKKKRRMKKSQ